MAANSHISWTNHTWNPWTGCHKVSAGCRNCYMFRDQARYRRDPLAVTRTANATWRKPYSWSRQASGQPAMVFVCSWSDFLHPQADQWRNDAWRVIRETPTLVYQILTKRPERILGNLPDDWPLPNVWLGVSIENNEHVDRADYLRATPATVRFVSYEPALGPLDGLDLAGIDWLIYGGESGPDRRPDNPQWARDIRDRCRNAGTAFFYKQASGPRPGMFDQLDGGRIQEYPQQ